MNWLTFILFAATFVLVLVLVAMVSFHVLQKEAVDGLERADGTFGIVNEKVSWQISLEAPASRFLIFWLISASFFLLTTAIVLKSSAKFDRLRRESVDIGSLSDRLSGLVEGRHSFLLAPNAPGPFGDMILDVRREDDHWVLKLSTTSAIEGLDSKIDSSGVFRYSKVSPVGFCDIKGLELIPYDMPSACDWIFKQTREGRDKVVDLQIRVSDGG